MFSMALSISTTLAFMATFILTAVANECDSYFTSSGLFKPSQDCNFLQFCCGTCDNRYCCTDPFRKLDDDFCSHIQNFNTATIVGGVVSVIIFILFVIACCVCPCCCLYKMCRKPRPVLATTTTVVTQQYPQQQPPNPATQYPGYNPVPAQPGFGAQPGYGGQVMPPAPYQGQPYAPGPPPPYQESGAYPAPYSQAAFDGSQAPYPLNPPVQPGYAHPPRQTEFNVTQPPYNPAYVEPPKTGY